MAGSLLSENLELRLIYKPGEGEDERGGGQKAIPAHEEKTLLGSFFVTPSFFADEKRIQGVKVRLLGIGTPWSGEIVANWSSLH